MHTLKQNMIATNAHDELALCPLCSITPARQIFPCEWTSSINKRRPPHAWSQICNSQHNVFPAQARTLFFLCLICHIAFVIPGLGIAAGIPFIPVGGVYLLCSCALGVLLLAWL